MTEAYLHFIWKLKRIPFHLLTTTDGLPIVIHSNGIHNSNESGPDFFNARMTLDGIEWAGQIEMHIKSSDWYRHNHDKDKAYDNVILHVVYEHDQEVYINGNVLPTIQLKNFIDQEHYLHWENFASSIREIPCEATFFDIDQIYIRSMIHRAIADRLNRKVNFLLYNTETGNITTTLYQLIAKAFGTKVNAVPFELITQELPILRLKRLTKKRQLYSIIHVSGLYDQTFTEELNIQIKHRQVPKQLWKRKGLRPPAFPEKRILQFANFIAACDLELLSSMLNPSQTYEYLNQLQQELNKRAEFKISDSLLEQLIINAVVPTYWLKAQQEENNFLQDYALELLTMLPAENNYIIKKWKKLGLKVQSAYESQALIEMYNEYCTFKKCMNCQVGIKLLHQ